MGSFRWVLQHIRKYKFRMLLGLLMVLMGSMLNMINPFLAGNIVDKVINEKERSLLPILLACMVGATFLKGTLRYLYQLIFETVSQKVYYKVRRDLYTKLQELDFKFFDTTRTGDIMTRMTSDADFVRHFVAWVIYNSFDRLLIFIFAICSMLTISVKFTLIMVAVTPITGIVAYKMSNTVRPAFFAIREQFSKLNSIVQENISGNRVVKAFAKEDYEITKFTRENEGYREKNMESAKIWETYLPILDSLAGSLSVIMILVGGVMVINGSITIGQLVTFNGLIWMLNDPMRMIGTVINDTQRFSTSAEKIIAILGTESAIENPEQPMKKDKITGRIEFKNVDFSYGDEKILQNISFKAEPGQTIAIVGPTGSGKSTLTNLIGRFYDRNSGEVLIDEVDIKRLDLKLLRSSISIAMQDIFLFSDTIEGNIAYGVPDASMERVQWAANSASAHDFITRFPEGYDTIIGERGVGLSGGQKQRIALARALIKDPSILILDDTTSSVDMETEYEIQKILKTIFKNKTTFIIAHRISSVKNADLILVLENGQIVERGRHEELVANKGYYYSVYANQFGDFDSELKEEVV